MLTHREVKCVLDKFQGRVHVVCYSSSIVTKLRHKFSSINRKWDVSEADRQRSSLSRGLFVLGMPQPAIYCGEEHLQFEEQAERR